DGRLNTGLINPGGADAALVSDPVLSGPKAAPGMAIRFAAPVVNLPGDDVVLFELHRRLGSPVGGDGFSVSPLHFGAGLHFTAGLLSITVERFDIDLDHARAQPTGPFLSHRLAKAPACLEDLTSGVLTRLGGGPNEDFKALAVGIDLSEMGYAEGAKVDGLFLQDKSGRGLLFDPVFIAGLPAPEPPNLLPAEPPRPQDRLIEEFLSDLASPDEIVFAVRVCGFDHWYANFGYAVSSVPEYPPQRGLPNEKLPARFRDGGRLCRLNLRTGKLTALLDDAEGGVRDPQMSYDAKTILFAYRKGGQDRYHLYEIDCDGSALRQLTDGACDDIEPAYLPDGGIVFASSRCNRFVNCWRTPVAVLHRCDGDGSNVRPLSTNVEHDNTPWVLPDGRILYMRWEYVDRSQLDFHHLWTMNPDGTGQMAFFGNEVPGYAMLDAKPIPPRQGSGQAGRNRVVASFSPGHGRPGHDGYLTVVSPTTGPDNPAAARRVGTSITRDPYPLSESWFLAASRAGIVVVNGEGKTASLYRLPPEDATRLQCHEPRPLRPRPRERVIPSRVQPSYATGRLALTDVYAGRNMAGVRRGEVKSLLVMEQLPKPVNFSGGPWPISIGGTFTLARVLGVVPVEADGSANFDVPAMRSLFLIALDEKGMSVKRMQSFLTVMPGETQSCVGCHESRLRTPSANRGLAALRRAPSRIEPVPGVSDVLDLARDVQPVLDRHCIACHQPERRDGGVDLTGDHTPLASVSYWNMLRHGLIADGRNEKFGNRPPRTIGSSASPLVKLMDGSHHDAKPSRVERDTVRLWVESSSVYAGTYAALGSGMHPVAFPVEVMERRCGGCHGQAPKGAPVGGGKLYFRFGSPGPYIPLVHTFMDLQRVRVLAGYYKFGRSRPPQSLWNLTRPVKSLLLRAPLAKAGGGLGLCRGTVFADGNDADYRAMLAQVEAASRKHAEEKRFDMPGFAPNVYYVRAMKRYGILPADVDEHAPLDVRAVDRAYWQSFWHRAGGVER
ncbi:hypothetical protein HQ560_10595, partial [bacterium]|nr:hypothetical protein [bacterium]